MHSFRALSYRNYRLYFFGQGLSLIGTWMTRIATSWLVYRLTGSTILLGVVGFASQIPTFLFAPFAGVLVDRWNCLRLLVVTQVLAMLQSLALAALALTGTITVGHVIVLSIVQGMINAFDIPARQAFVVELVERPEDLGNAIALNSSIFNGARLIGPSMAGLLIAWAGEGVCFLLDGISYLAVIAAFCTMRVRAKPRKIERRPLLGQLREGLRYASGFAPIRAVLGLIALISLVGMPYAVLMPVFAGKILHGGPHIFGFLMGASGMGALAGALYLASRNTVLGLGKVIVLATALFGLGLIAFGLSRVAWVSLVLMLGIGCGTLVQMAASNTLIQTVVEDDKRGRVMSFYAMAFMGMTPFGSLLVGSLADWLGAPAALVIAGAGCLLGAAAFAHELPRIRQSMQPVYVRKGILPEVAAGIQAAVNLAVPPED